MNICFVISGGSRDQHLGGSTLVDLEFLKYCAASSHNTAVFTFNNFCFDPGSIRFAKNIEAVVLPENRFFSWWRHVKISYAFIKVYVENPQTIFRVNSFFSSVLELLPLLLFSFGKCKFFIQFHHKDHNKFRNVLVGWVMGKAKIIFCPSRAAQSEAQILVKKKVKSLVVNHGVQDRFFVTNKPRRISAENSKLKLLFIGRLEERKNPIFLLEVAKMLEEKNVDFSLTIIGGGLLKAVMADMCHQNSWGKHVVMLDSVSEKNKIEIYARSDIFLFPSLQEGFGLVVAEAMASGLAVIGFNTTATPELVEDGMGFLTDINDTSAFVECINLLHEDRAMLHKFQKNAIRGSKRKFNWSKQMSTIFSAIEKIY